MIGTALVSTTEGCNDNIPVTPNYSNISQSFFSPKNKCARKYLKQFPKTLEVKPKTYVWILCAAKAKQLEIKGGN